MDFAMFNLGQLPNLLKSKFIQGNQSCQIHHYGGELIIGEELKKMFRLAVIIATLMGCVGMAQAQQPAKIPLIGFLVTSSRSAIPARIEAFRQGLRELGYVEGKNIVIE